MIVANYNVFYQKFDNKYTTEEEFLWKNRLPIIKQLFSKVDPDIITLQELSVNSVKDLQYDNYAVFAVNNNNGVNCNLYENDDSTGIMAGIMFRKDKFKTINTGYFQTEQGSSSSAKASVWVILEDRYDGEEYLVVSSHFTMRGKGNRIISANQLLENIEPMINRNVILGGDYNLFEDDDGFEAYEIIAEHYENFICENHHGERDSFIGYSWDNFKHTIIDGHLVPKLMMSNMFHKLDRAVIKSFSYPAEFKDGELIEYEKISSRYTTSDHCFIGFEIE